VLDFVMYFMLLSALLLCAQHATKADEQSLASEFVGCNNNAMYDSDELLNCINQ
jgi:hypothetical protein